MPQFGLQAPQPQIPWWAQQMMQGQQTPQQQGGGWGLPQWGTAAGIGLGLAGDIWGANTQRLDLPSFEGGGFVSQAREQLQPQRQAQQAQSASLTAQERAGLGAQLASEGMDTGTRLRSMRNMVRAGQAQRDMQAYAAWQKNITDLAMQLYQYDMQRRAAEYQANQGTGVPGALSQIGQTAAAFLPLLL